MTTILRIDSSSRTDGSQSHALGDYFERAWQSHDPGTRVVRRDLVAEPIAHIGSQAIASYGSPADPTAGDSRAATTALSGRLIAELQAADLLLLTVPIYDFSIPSALKAWIDHIVRIDHTFSYDGTRFTGLVAVKQAHVIFAYGVGGYIDGGPFSPYNFLEPYLKTLLGFLGIPEVRFHTVEVTMAHPAAMAANVEQAERRIDSVIASAGAPQVISSDIWRTIQQ